LCRKSEGYNQNDAEKRVAKVVEATKDCAPNISSIRRCVIERSRNTQDF